MNIDEKIFENLSSYMKNSKEEKLLEQKLIEISHKTADRNEIIERMIEEFEKIVPMEIKRQVYKDIEDEFN
ncbi:hypothetical protein NUSPORA_02746 [Nucleospora cyclopteri]